MKKLLTVTALLLFASLFLVGCTGKETTNYTRTQLPPNGEINGGANNAPNQSLPPLPPESNETNQRDTSSSSDLPPLPPE